MGTVRKQCICGSELTLPKGESRTSCARCGTEAHVKWKPETRHAPYGRVGRITFHPEGSQGKP